MLIYTLHSVYHGKSLYFYSNFMSSKFTLFRSCSGSTHTHKKKKEKEIHYYLETRGSDVLLTYIVHIPLHFRCPIFHFSKFGHPATTTFKCCRV